MVSVNLVSTRVTEAHGILKVRSRFRTVSSEGETVTVGDHRTIQAPYAMKTYSGPNRAISLRSSPLISAARAPAQINHTTIISAILGRERGALDCSEAPNGEVGKSDMQSSSQIS